MSEGAQPRRQDRDRGVYGITVAAELVDMQVQNLRVYERRGLLQPDRTDGGTRRYSENDLVRLRRIGTLLEDGLNLAGVAMVLDLEDDNADLRQDNADLRHRLAKDLRDRQSPRAGQPRAEPDGRG